MPHFTIVDYFEAVGEASNQAIFEKYGETNEGRDLVYMVISSQENIRNIENLRQRNLDIVSGETSDGDNAAAIVWLSFGVHGNEAGATNSACLLYTSPSPRDS